MGIRRPTPEPGGGAFICPDGIANPLATAEDFEVDPATVGQFTGLLDKNGKEVWEGDIVKSDRVGVIDFRNGVFGIDDRNPSTPDSFSDTSEWEVLGNIHDNSK